MIKNDDILKEINEMAPVLADKLKESKAIPTDAYFETMQDSIFAKLEDQDKEEEILKDYFEHLPNQVLEQVKPRSFRLNIRYISSIAAILVLVVSAVWVMQNTISASSVEAGFVENLSEDEALYLMSELASVEDLVDINEDENLWESSSSEVLDEEWLEYLDEESLYEALEL